jgi:hypothetical protein
MAAATTQGSTNPYLTCKTYKQTFKDRLKDRY